MSPDSPHQHSRLSLAIITLAFACAGVAGYELGRQSSPTVELYYEGRVAPVGWE